MDTENFNVKPTTEQFLGTVFKWMPVCALVIDVNGFIQEVNVAAIDFFRASTKEDFIFDKQIFKNMAVDGHQVIELIKSIQSSSLPIRKEILLRRFDRSLVGVDMNACLFPENTHLILVQFTELDIHRKSQTVEISQAFSQESLKLRPYLNKHGIELLNHLAFNNGYGSSVWNNPDNKIYPELLDPELMVKLSNTFPDFSKNDLIICGFLSLKLSVDEIAALTGKSSNSLRVSFHRILKKADIASSKEFLRKLHLISST